MFSKPHFISVFALTIAIFPLSSNAQTAPVFAAPDAIKVGWDAQALSVTDIDGDGLNDIAIINNDKARINLRYGMKEGESSVEERSLQQDKWDPILENSQHIKSWVTTGLRAYDLCFFDVNGDGKLDLAYTTERDELVVRLQKDNREWAPPKTFQTKSTQNNWATLATADINGDKATDLVLLTEEHIALFYNKNGELQTPSYLSCPEEAFHLQLTDCNSDGAIDICYQADYDGKSRAIVRLQKNGDFPVQQLLRIDSPQSIVTYGENSITSLSSITQAIETHQVGSEKNTLDKTTVSLLTHNLGDNKASALTIAHGDYDKDGDIDLIIANEKEANLKLLTYDESGSFSSPTNSSTVSGITFIEMADLIPGGNLECLIFSEEENIIGISTLKTDGSCPFPTEIPFKGEPSAISLLPATSNIPARIIVLSHDSYSIITYIEDTWSTHTVELDEIGQDVEWINCADINRDGRADILILPDDQPLKILLQTEQNTFELVDKQTGFSEKLTNDLKPTDLYSSQTSDDLIICHDSFARTITLGDNSKLSVVHQINLQKKDIKLTFARAANILGDENLEYIFYDKKSKSLEISDLNGEILATIPIPLNDFSGLIITPLNQSGSQDILCYGGKELIHIPVNQKLLKIQPISSYHSSVKNMVYEDLRSGDLNGDGKQDIIVVDSRDSHILEVLLKTDSGWNSQQHFIIYDADRHYRGKRGSDFSPSDFSIVDVNSDGMNDLIMHIHDRLLIYLQIKP